MSDDGPPAETRQRLAATRTHYEAHPVPHHLSDRSLIGELIRDRAFPLEGWVLDVGCGEGVVSSRLAAQGCRVVGFDLTVRAAELTRAAGVPTVIASNLRLPVRDGAASAAVSNGVIHHTPDPRGCFAELSRVLRPGGLLFVSVYNRESVYHPLYTYFGGACRVVRRALGRTVGNAVLAVVFGLPFWLATLAGLLVFQRRFRWVSPASAFRSFMDQFVTPVASFHRRDEVLGWAREEGLVPVRDRLDFATGWMISFLLRKG